MEFSTRGGENRVFLWGPFGKSQRAVSHVQVSQGPVVKVDELGKFEKCNGLLMELRFTLQKHNFQTMT